MRLMKSCKYFLGVWEPEVKVPGGWWPSPWLLWELGVAQQLQLNVRLLISDKVVNEAWRVVSDIPHTMYNTLRTSNPNFARR